ncbi:hypothetical protein [Caballeronia arvi]|nr:hypothetical protein [Caballeronia arvi]
MDKELNGQVRVVRGRFRLIDSGTQQYADICLIASVSVIEAERISPALA